MELSTILWMTDALLACLILINARDVLSPRGSKMRRRRLEILNEVVAATSNRPGVDEILAAWEPIAVSSKGSRQGEDDLSRCIAALDAAQDIDVEALRTVCLKTINAVNVLGSHVDEGLIRPKDLVRSHPALHSALLFELHAVRPVIWYESLVRGRGRWGYRVAQMGGILCELRAASSRPQLWAAKRLCLEELTFLDLPRLNTFHRFALRLGLKFRSPTIDVKSKLRQRRQAEQMCRTLDRLGIATVPLDLIPDAVDW